jgi:hypothetical protein
LLQIKYKDNHNLLIAAYQTFKIVVAKTKTKKHYLCRMKNKIGHRNIDKAFGGILLSPPSGSRNKIV